ncbi:MAG: ABC transporter six-transmembrane domain-containing protein [Bacteroidota bacterium]
MRIRSILYDFRWRLVVTLFLVLAEVGVSLFFPLFIGFAIRDVLVGSHQGAIQLGVLGGAALLFGAARRFFDSRLYARIYTTLADKAIGNVSKQAHSVKAARLSMLRELVEFMENMLPELINSSIGLLGVLMIIATLNMSVFFVGLIAALIILFVYLISSKRTIRFNTAYNDELEKQVDAISANATTQLPEHLHRLMQWNIKLSDLEVVNFSISWMTLLAFLVLSVVLPIEDGFTEYGALFALVMYAFQYLEYVIQLPLIYQHWLRLKEIQLRLEHF